jgi:Ssp1 endopeptidase immunity protein Rap1a
MRKHAMIGLMIPVLLLGRAAAGAGTEDNFQLNTTSDLVALCSAGPSDPMMTAAVNWCHGFMVGTYRVLAQVEAKQKRKVFCVPTPTPNRNDAVAKFVAWAKANPSQMGQSPSDSVLGYLEANFPCGQTK